MGELDIPSSFKLFVNVKGVHFVDPETNKTRQSFKWSQVRDWLYTDSTVKIFFEDDEGMLMYILMVIKREKKFFYFIFLNVLFLFEFFLDYITRH